MKNKGILVAVVLVLIAMAGAYAFMGRSKPSGSTSSQSTGATSGTVASSVATITYTSSGFSPATTTIKSGQTVTFTNSSDMALQVDSDPHPVHTDDEELNVGTIAPGQSKPATLTKKGTFGFHNHLDSTNTASITVQ